MLFKDEIYKRIFGQDPFVFRKLPHDDAIYYSSYSHVIEEKIRDKYYSTAEILFGGHVINDAIAFWMLVADVAKEVFTWIPGVNEILLGIDVTKALFFSGSIINVLSGEASSFLDNYIQEAKESKNANTNNKIKTFKIFTWAERIFNVLDMIVDAYTPPILSDSFIYNRVANKNYATSFAISEDSELTMLEIMQLIPETT